MNHLFLVIKREYLTKVRNKSFIVMTFLSPLIFIGLAALVGYLSSINSNKLRTVAIIDESGLFAEEFNDTQFTKYEFLDGVTIEEAKLLTEKGSYFGLLHIPDQPLSTLTNTIEFFSKESPGFTFIEAISEKLENKIFHMNLAAQNVSYSLIDEAKIPVSIQLENFTGEKTSKMGNVLKLIFGGAAGYLLMMFIIIYGNMIMRSVIEEKTNRIIEIIISSVKPIQLMMGKIIGTSLAGVTQFLMWVLVGALLLTGLSMFFGMDVGSLETPQREMLETVATQQGMHPEISAVLYELRHMPIVTLVIAFLVYFIGGYLLYSSLYAAIGAAGDNETDTQQFMFPIIMPLMLAIYVGFFTVIEDPHGTVSVIFSYIPFTSPIVMLMRIPFGVPWWELVISIVLLYLTFMVMVWFAAKIYRVGILMYGKKPTYKELIKWLKY